MLKSLGNILPAARRKDAQRSRKEAVRLALISDVSPVAERPYIEGGVYHWNYVDRPVRLDFVWPDVPLAVLVSTHLGPFGATADTSRRLWEEGIALESETVAACRRAYMPLLVIGPNDPVDIHSITTAAAAIIDSHIKQVTG